MAQTTVFSQPSTIDTITHYLSHIPTDIINLSCVIPAIKQPTNISLWDENVQYLQSFPNVEPPKVKGSYWVESVKQGLKFLVEFNQKNRIVSLYVKSIEFPLMCKRLKAGEVNLHKFDNQKGFSLSEIPPLLTKSGKIERFLFGNYSFRHQNKNFRAAIRITDLDKLQSFSIPENHPSDYSSFASILGLHCDHLNYVLSHSGLTYFKEDQFFPRLIQRIDQTIELPKPTVDSPEAIGFLDDCCLFWKCETHTTITRIHYYLTDIQKEPKQIKFLFSDTSNNKPKVLPVGKSFILVVRKPFQKNQEATILNVETFDKFHFPINRQFGEIDQVYVASPGVIKYNQKLNKTFFTIDVANENFEKFIANQ